MSQKACNKAARRPFFFWQRRYVFLAVICLLPCVCLLSIGLKKWLPSFFSAVDMALEGATRQDAAARHRYDIVVGQHPRYRTTASLPAKKGITRVIRRHRFSLVSALDNIHDICGFSLFMTCSLQWGIYIVYIF